MKQLFSSEPLQVLLFWITHNGHIYICSSWLLRLHPYWKIVNECVLQSVVLLHYFDPTCMIVWLLTHRRHCTSKPVWMSKSLPDSRVEITVSAEFHSDQPLIVSSRSEESLPALCSLCWPRLSLAVIYEKHQRITPSCRCIVIMFTSKTFCTSWSKLERSCLPVI